MNRFVFLFLTIIACFVCTGSASATGTKYNEMSLQDQLTYTAQHLEGPWVSPKAKAPETPEERNARLGIITSAIILELPNAQGLRGEKWFWDDKVLAWSTFTKMWWESGRFSLAVHSGKKRGDAGRSVCLGQIMRGEEELVGTDLESTRKCVRRVMAFLIMHQNGCLAPQAKPSAYSMAMIYAGYGTGNTCNPNHWMKIHKKGGGYVMNPDGTFKRNYWARKRGWMFWQLYTGKHTSQRAKSD